MSAPALRIALVQTSLYWEDAAANHDALATKLAPLAGNVDLVVLPEMFPTGFTMRPEGLAQPPDGISAHWLRGQARRLDAAVAGSVATRDGERAVNRLLFATPDGNVSRYDKRHLFRMGGEDAHYHPGRDGLVVEWRGLRIAPLVCYDLRFPVFSRRRPDYDYDVLLYVANWPAPRRDPWRALLIARAIENQCYVLGVNRIGRDGQDLDYAGDSLVVDPRGRVLADASDADCLLRATLPLDAVREFRDRFPAHLDADRFTLDG